MLALYKCNSTHVIFIHRSLRLYELLPGGIVAGSMVAMELFAVTRGRERSRSPAFASFDRCRASFTWSVAQWGLYGDCRSGLDVLLDWTIIGAGYALHPASSAAGLLLHVFVEGVDDHHAVDLNWI